MILCMVLAVRSDAPPAPAWTTSSTLRDGRHSPWPTACPHHDANAASTMSHDVQRR
jgi:hypothetical protein